MGWRGELTTDSAESRRIRWMSQRGPMWHGRGAVEFSASHLAATLAAKQAWVVTPAPELLIRIILTALSYNYTSTSVIRPLLIIAGEPWIFRPECTGSISTLGGYRLGSLSYLTLISH